MLFGNKMRHINFIVITVLSVLSIFITTEARAGKCPYYFLRTDRGEIINPMTGQNVNEPISTKKTCGQNGCHDYNKITKGYHFQLGWDEIKDDFDKNKPWRLSNGMMGNWCPVPYMQFAKKKNSNPDEIDLTPFLFASIGSREADKIGVPGCGGCHVGGGGLEYDREGNRYDEHLKKNPLLARSLDGDYFQSSWDKTGVVEGDCFICHLPGYDLQIRNKNLKLLNFKWASTAGSRIGSVAGSVRDGQVPRVVYNKRLFNEDGTVALDIPSKSPSKNCIACHGSIDMAKRGTTWGDRKNPCVHNIGKMECTDCHVTDSDHNIGKGDEIVSRVRDDLDNTMLSCEDCHMNGKGNMSTPRPSHLMIRENHLEKIACQTCHIPTLNRKPIDAIVALKGPAEKYVHEICGKIVGANTTWGIKYMVQDHRKKDPGKIWPVNGFVVIFFTNNDGGTHYPLFIKETTTAVIKSGVNKHEIYTDEDITKVLATLKETLKGNRRFREINPCYHKGEKMYCLDNSGKLITSEDTTWAGHSHEFNISHNVLPRNMALGSNGCTDCHAISKDAKVFNGDVVIDVWGKDGKPVTIKSGYYLGYSFLAFAGNYFYNIVLWVLPYMVLALIGFVFFLIIQYTIEGPRGAAFLQRPAEIHLHSLSEHWTHLLRMGVFFVLVIAGHILIFSKIGMIGVIVSLYKQSEPIRLITGVFLLFVAFLIFYIWVKDARNGSEFSIRKGGSLPDRANEEKKIILLFKWTNRLAVFMIVTGVFLLLSGFLPFSVNIIISGMHGLAGVVFAGLIIIHAYLYIIAEPGSWRNVFTATYSRIVQLSGGRGRKK